MANRRPDKKRLYDKRRAILDEIKLESGCIDCGYNAAPEALDFDHRNPEEKTICGTNPINYSWARIIAEISKCDVRCANCHRIRSKALRHGQARRVKP